MQCSGQFHEQRLIVDYVTISLLVSNSGPIIIMAYYLVEFDDYDDIVQLLAYVKLLYESSSASVMNYE